MKDQIDTHSKKISNVEKSINPSKIKGDSNKYKEGLVKKWGKEIENFQAKIDKINNYLKKYDK